MTRHTIRCLIIGEDEIVRHDVNFCLGPSTEARQTDHRRLNHSGEAYYRRGRSLQPDHLPYLRLVSDFCVVPDGPFARNPAPTARCSGIHIPAALARCMTYALKDAHYTVP